MRISPEPEKKDNTIKMIVIVMLFAVLGIIGMNVLESIQKEQQPVADTQEQESTPTMIIRPSVLPLSLFNYTNQQKYLASLQEGKYGYAQNNSIATYIDDPSKLKLYQDKTDTKVFVLGVREEKAFVRGFVDEQTIADAGTNDFVLSPTVIGPFENEVLVNLGDITSIRHRGINVGEDAINVNVLDISAMQITLQSVNLKIPV